MLEFATADKTPKELYPMFIRSIVPRPIAFVATLSRDGVRNLAPFSFFMGVCGDPPTIAFSVGDRPSGMKDTSRNIVEDGSDFVVHIVSESIADAMNATCADFGAHVDEFSESGLTPVKATRVNAHRVAEAPIALECTLNQHLRVGKRNSLIIGDVVYWHIQDSVLDEQSRVDPAKLQALGRMGSMDYTRSADVFQIIRPELAADDPRAIPATASPTAKPRQS